MSYGAGSIRWTVEKRGKMYVVNILNDHDAQVGNMMSFQGQFWLKEAPMNKIKNALKQAIKDEQTDGSNFDEDWRLSLTSFQEDMEAKVEEERYTPESEEEEEQGVSSLVLDDGTIVEQIMNDNHPKFAVCNGDGISYVEFLARGGSTYIPVSNEMIDKEVVKFPTKAEEYGTINELVTMVKDYIRTYVDFSEEFLEISAWYIILTWVYDQLNTIPYIRLLGDYGTGKSRALDVIGGVCYKPCIVSGAVTPAPIYRIIERFKGTLVIDEGDLRQSDEKNEVVTILNCGFERNRPVIRCKKDNPDDIQTFDAFCPKIISSRKLFWDQALESRCMTETMGETTRTDILEVLPPIFYNQQQELRNKLLMFRFKNLQKIRDSLGDDVKLDSNLEPRLRQAARAFVIIFSHDDDMLNRFKRFLQHYQCKLVEDRSETLEGMIAAAMWDLAADISPENYMTPSDIAMKIPTKKGHATPQTVGRVLTGMKIRRVLKRVSSEPKRCVVWENEKMHEIFRRYVITYHEVVTGVTDVTTVAGSDSLLLSLFRSPSKHDIKKHSSEPNVVVTTVTGVTKKDEQTRLDPPERDGDAYEEGYPSPG